MTYTVKSGDSLSAIARDVIGNIDLWPNIARLNSISSPYVIKPGQVLQLPDNAASIKVTPAPAMALPVASGSTTITNNTSTSFWGFGIGGLLVTGAIIAFIVYKKKKKS
jgi:LysM repeat protein